MRAAIYNGEHDIELTELQTPVPGDQDVLLRTLCAGICGSDVSAYLHGPRAHRIAAGSEFGHEVISEVAAVGSGVQGLKVGDRVYPYPRLAKGDTSRAGTLGGFSEYILVPDAEVGKQLYLVDDAIPDNLGAMIEPFTVATRAAKRAEPKPGETAIVFGAGTIGMAAAIVLKSLGCARVMVVDLSDFRLDKAVQLGFATCNSAREDLISKATETFGSAPAVGGSAPDVDIYIEATGADVILSTFQSMAKLYARMVVTGVHSEPVGVNLAALSFGQNMLIGAGGYLPEDVEFVLDLMKNTEFDIAAIHTHSFPLEQIIAALETASDPNNALHVSIRY
jgi:2-desacetyl-2-hydroxyethyl bacteriochlorophyllide A dehydrogenase